MSRKDYKLIAAVISDCALRAEGPQARLQLEILARAIWRRNSAGITRASMRAASSPRASRRVQRHNRLSPRVCVSWGGRQLLPFLFARIMGYHRLVSANRRF